MEARLAQILTEFPGQVDRLEELRAWMEEAFQKAVQGNGSIEEYVFIVSKVVEGSSSVLLPMHARHIVTLACQGATQLATDLRVEAAKGLLAVLDSPILSYGDQVNQLRKVLAEDLEAHERWAEAVEVYAKIPSENALRGDTRNEEVAQLFVKIAWLYLKCDDTASAQTYLNRAKNFFSTSTTGGSHDYRVCTAKICEYEGEFSKAAQQYYSIYAEPISPGQNLYPSTPLEYLSNAMICAILASVGQQRSQILSYLYHDERTKTLPQFDILQCVYRGRFLSRQHIEDLSKAIAQQFIKPEDRQRVLAKSATEHNLTAALALYRSIKFDNLAEFLNITSETAETTAAEMIYEDRLSATIDQVDGILEFKAETNEALVHGDSKFHSICQTADKCCELILEKYPGFRPS